MGNTLLDDLGEYLFKDYLSELKNLDFVDRRRAIRFLMKRKPGDYTIRTWNDAHEYITGHKCDDLFPDEARVNLISCLSK